MKNASLFSLLLSPLLVWSAIAYSDPAAVDAPPVEPSASPSPMSSPGIETSHQEGDFPTSVQDFLRPIKNINNDVQSGWHDLWEKASISAAVTPFGSTYTDGIMALGYQLSYHASAQPAYIENYQQRLDTYQLVISPAIPIDGFSLNSTFNGQVIFSRLMPTKDAAITAIPVWLDHFPIDASMVTKQFQPGDMVRLDLSLGVSAGVGIGQSFTPEFLGALSANVSRGSELIADIYRMKDYVDTNGAQHSLARVRILALRHQIQGNAGGSIGGGTNFFTQIWDKFVGHWLTFNLISVNDSWTPILELPLESYMVDYVFDLAKPQAITAYNDLVQNLASWELFKTLNFQIESTSVENHLEQLLAKTEAQVTADRALAPVDRSVDRVFNGTTVTDYATFTLSSKIRVLINLWDREISLTRSSANIKGTDHNGNPLSVVYYSSQANDSFNALREFRQTIQNDTSESVFDGVQEPTSKMISITPTKPEIIHIARNLSDKNLNSNQINKAKAFVDIALADAITKQIPWGNFIDGNTKNDAYVNVRFLFKGPAMNQFKQISEADLKTAIRNLMTKDPYTSYVQSLQTAQYSTANSLDYDSDNSAAGMEQARLNSDIQALSSRILILISPSSSVPDKAKVLDDLRKLDLFNEIGPALLISLLPQDSLQDLIYVGIKASALGETPINWNFGKDDTSPEYASFRFMISTLNDRSFDMRLMLNTQGNYETLDPVQSKQVCTGCDTAIITK